MTFLLVSVLGANVIEVFYILGTDRGRVETIDANCAHVVTMYVGIEIKASFPGHIGHQNKCMKLVCTGASSKDLKVFLVSNCYLVCLPGRVVHLNPTYL